MSIRIVTVEPTFFIYIYIYFHFRSCHDVSNALNMGHPVVRTKMVVQIGLKIAAGGAEDLA